MKIKYLLILMFLFCFVSNAFGQVKVDSNYQNDELIKTTSPKKSLPLQTAYELKAEISGVGREIGEDTVQGDEGWEYQGDYGINESEFYFSDVVLGDEWLTWGRAYYRVYAPVGIVFEDLVVGVRGRSNDNQYNGGGVDLYLWNWSTGGWDSDPICHIPGDEPSGGGWYGAHITSYADKYVRSSDGRISMYYEYDFDTSTDNDDYHIDWVRTRWEYEPADLEITSVSISPTPPLDENESFNATVYFRNIGEGDAGGFWLDFFIDESSAPSIPCDGDFYIWISGLDAGAYSSYVFDYDNMYYSSTGTKHQYYVIDSWENVPESNEDNVYGPHDVEVEEGNISITINSSPSGLKVKVDGSNQTTPYYTNWVPGASLELEGYTQNKNDIKYAFDRWENGSTQNPRTVYPATDKTYTAYYNATHYYLDIDIQGQGSVSPIEDYYPINSTQALTATPATGWSFSHWSDDISTSENPCYIIMNSPKSVTAHFVEVDGIPCGVLVVNADNYNPELTEAWGNVQIKHIQNADYLVSIPSGHVYINSQNNTITIEDDDNFSIIGSPYWNFSGTSWDFDCNAGTAEISSNLDLGLAGAMLGYNWLIDFEHETLTGSADFNGLYSVFSNPMYPSSSISFTISFDLDYFGFTYEMGEDLLISNNIVLEILNNYVSFKYYMSENIIEFDANIGNGVHLKYVSNDGSEFYFINFNSPFTAVIHIRWDGNEDKLEFTEDNQVGISIPLPAPVLRDRLGDEEYERLLREGYIFEITDSKNGTRASVNVGIKIKANSYIKFSSPTEFNIDAELSAGISILWSLVDIELETAQAHITLNENEKKLKLCIESGHEVKINGLSLNRVFYGESAPDCQPSPNYVLMYLFWGNNDDQVPYYFLEGSVYSPFSFLPFSLEGWLTNYYESYYMEGNCIVKFLGILPILNASVIIYENSVCINGYWIFYEKNKVADTLNVLWESDFTDKNTRCTFLERIAPIENYENFLLEENSFVFYDTTNASFFSLNSKYDGMNLNWQPYFDDEDDLKFDLIQIDGFKFSISSDITLRLEILNDSSRYVEISKDSSGGQIGYNYGWELIDDYMILTISWSSDSPPEEDFKLILKNVTETDTLNLTNLQGNFQTSKAPASIWKYQDDLLKTGVVYELVLNGLFNPIYGSNGDIFTVDWAYSFSNPISGFIFNNIRPYWNVEFDSLIVEVSTNEPSDCWLYYGENLSSLQDTIQSSAVLSTEHHFQISKDDIHSRWVYKIESSKEDGNTIYAGPLIVPPRGSPTADFTAVDTIGVKPLTVKFIDESHPGVGGAEINMWYWDFGDGTDTTYSTYIDTILHTYENAGFYNVSLTVTDEEEEIGIKVKPNLVEVWDPPIANLAADPPLEGEPPLEVQFNDDSIPGSGEIISWYWEFGDDSTSTDENPTHEYTEEDHYDVTLYITDSNNLEDSITKEDFIFVRYKPIAKFSAVDTIGVKPLIVNFTDESYHPGNAEIDEWYWDFGDSETTTYTTFINTITHTYQDSGHYTVSLKVTDTNNVSDTITKNNYIEVWEPPIAGFSAVPPLEGEPTLEVKFNDESIKGSGTINRWKWHFGDGDSSSVQNPTHEYTDEGHYDVTLIITDSNGLIDSKFIEDFIFVRYKPIAKFSAVDTIGVKPLIVNFTDESYHPGNAEIDEWHWDFGDGEDTTYTSFINTITHTYPDSGHYTVSLKVTDTNNVSDTTIEQNMIEVWEPPVADYTYSPDSGPPPLTVYFEDNSQQGSGEIVFWHWKFGDDIEDPGQHQDVTHTYHNPGCYYVTLIIRDSNGLEDSVISEDCIKVYKGPKAKFSTLPISGEPPLEVEFTDESIPGSGDINYWNWDFGDGETSNTQDPAHNYEESGIYTVSLIVTDTNNESGTIIKENYIVVAKNCFYPNPYNPESGIIGTFRYTPKSSGNYTITIYDVSNQIVIELDCGSQTTNEIFEFNWNGKNASGKDVANGTYFYIIKSNTGDSYMNKLSILK